MNVSAAGSVNYMSAIIQQAHSSRGEALIQLLSALQDAERAHGEPLADISSVNKIDIYA